MGWVMARTETRAASPAARMSHGQGVSWGGVVFRFCPAMVHMAWKHRKEVLPIR